MSAVTGRYQERGRKTGSLVLAAVAGGLILTFVIAGVVLVRGTLGTIAAALHPTSTPSPTSTPAPTYTPTFTPVPTATSTPTPEIVGPQDHYWLARPFTMENNNEPTRFYPYGSTGRGRYRIHHGSDFPNPFGTPVYAAASGRVIVAGSDERIMYGERVGFYGQLVILQLDQQYHDHKVWVLYGHLSQVHVDFLQEVEEGDPIGEVGMTGVAIGPHLHLEVRVGENGYQHTHNPELWLRPLPGKGTIAGQLLDSQGRPLPEQPLTLYRKESPDRRWQDLTTYPSSGVNADDEWVENFVLGDAPVGEYLIRTYVNGHLYTAEVTVDEAKTSFVTIEVP
jgi:murein DD-endopeptidase MepM/ murein hydrolase activator NlpD